MSWWQPLDSDTEPTITVGLGGIYKIYSARIVWRDIGIDFDKDGFKPEPISFVITATDEDGTKKIVYDGSKNNEDNCCDYVEFTPTYAKSVTITFKQKKNYKFGITDFTVFGEMDD